MWTSLSEQATAHIFEALRAIVQSAPQLARLTRAAERQADAATLAALVQYRAHLATQAPDLAARAIVDASIRALGRRLAVQAADRGDSAAGKDGAE